MTDVDAHVEERLLAAIMRRVLTVERDYVDLAGNRLCIDGWVTLTDDQVALVERITGEWEA
jgi:hypothetical protein